MSDYIAIKKSQLSLDFIKARHTDPFVIFIYTIFTWLFIIAFSYTAV